jgi:hypothetical protein
MNLRNVFIFGIVCLWLLDVVGWFAVLFLWAVPTMSIGLGQFLSLSLGTIVALILYFVLWMPAMIYGLVLGIFALLNNL